MTVTDHEQAYRHIATLIARYAELVDDGRFGDVDTLLERATFFGSGDPVSGPGEIEAMLQRTIIRYADGTPGTQHVVTNVIVDLAGNGTTATARSAVTVLQATDNFPLQVVVAGRYHDAFARDGDGWHFTQRRLQVRLVGDASHHLRRS